MKSREDLKRFKDMSEKDLLAELKKIKKDYSLHQLKVKAGKADNFSQVDKIRKNIARIMTILNEKQFGAENGK